MAIGLGTPVWLLLLATSQPGAVQGRVVTDFRECAEFFKDGIPPRGFDGMSNLVRICQNYDNRYHFATLYRTDMRIPVYSAYKYEGGSGNIATKTCRSSDWCIEPQIDDPTARPAMICSKKISRENQAVNEDYQNSSYDRGHLYPFQFNERNQKVTCTLTNAIPMIPADNKKWYHYAERKIKDLAEKCNRNSREMYVVTGSANYTSGSKMKNRVVVPGRIWSAACCTSSGRPAVRTSTPVTPGNTNVDFSVAYTKELLTGENTARISLRELQQALNVTIFNQCRGMDESEEAENERVVIALLNEPRIAGPKRKRQRHQQYVPLP